MSTTQSASRLLEENAEFLRRLALALLGRHDEVDDVLQEVSVAALRNPSVAVERGRPWLAVVLKNAARKVWRSDKRRGTRELARAKLDEGRMADDAPSFVEQLEMARKLHDAVDELPDTQCEAITLRYYQGLKPGAIATRLETPVETIRTRIKRGLSNLRATLGGRDEHWRAHLLLFAAPGTLGSAAATGVAAATTTAAAWWTAPAAALLVAGAITTGVVALSGEDDKPVQEVAETASLEADEEPSAPPPAQEPATPPAAEDADRGKQPGEEEAASEEPAEKTGWPGTDKEWAALVADMRAYLNPDEDLYRGRMPMRVQLRYWLERGYDLLADLPTLRRCIYEARSFHAQMNNRNYLRDEAVKYKGERNYNHIRSDEMLVGWTTPKKYPKKNKALAKGVRIKQVPLLVSTIEKQDQVKNPDWPAFALLARRYPSKKKTYWGNFRNEWMTLVPVASAGRYIDQDGRLDGGKIFYPINQFCRRYHVDFDRIVFDGREEALAVATKDGYMFAGIVIRAGEIKTDEEKELLVNAHTVPLFVYCNDKLAAALKEAGHPDVTTGGDEELKPWLNKRRRKIPTKFTWKIATTGHTFAHWMIFEEVRWASQKREVNVEVVDTEEDPNTIKIEAIGVRRLSLFLNDEIVDLSRKVRVVINGHVMKDEMVTRDLDVMFNRDPLKLRQTMMFSLLFPARFPRIVVKGEGTFPEPPPGDREQTKAAAYLEAATRLIEQQRYKSARPRLEACIDLGDTPSREEAERLLKSLVGK